MDDKCTKNRGRKSRDTLVPLKVDGTLGIQDVEFERGRVTLTTYKLPIKIKINDCVVFGHGFRKGTV